MINYILLYYIVLYSMRQNIQYWNNMVLLLGIIVMLITNYVQTMH